MIRLAIAASLVLVTAPVLASAQQAPAADAPKAEAKADAKAKTKAEDGVVCRMERVVGSNIPERVCRTQRRVKEEQQAAEAYSNKVRTTSGQETRPSVGR